MKRYRTLLSDSALWEGFRFRAGDVVISPPPKCGTTWMQMLCALLIFDRPRLDRPLAEISPWFDAAVDDHAAVVAAVEAQRHRRFLKTHTPLDGLVFDEQATYICVGRDPRDVAVSYAHSMQNLDRATFRAALARSPELRPGGLRRPPADPVERFWRWVDDEGRDDQRGAGATLARTIHHLQTFWDQRHRPQVALFHYDELRDDLPGQMRRLADQLSIEVSDERLHQLAAAASLDHMRAHADELVPDVGRPLWQDNRAFFHSGTSGQWRALVEPADLGRYWDGIAELATPDLAAWLHRGDAADAGRATAP